MRPSTTIKRHPQKSLRQQCGGGSIWYTHQGEWRGNDAERCIHVMHYSPTHLYVGACRETDAQPQIQLRNPNTKLSCTAGCSRGGKNGACLRWAFWYNSGDETTPTPLQLSKDQNSRVLQDRHSLHFLSCAHLLWLAPALLLRSTCGPWVSTRNFPARQGNSREELVMR